MNYTKYKNYIPLSKMTKKDNKPEYLIVHCSDSDVDNFESIQRYHITEREFENIGYHYLIERDGTIKPGRPEFYHGAHVSQDNMNKRSIGICIAGKFDTKSPSEKQISALKHLLEQLMAKYMIPIENIKPHRFWEHNKTCFGSFLPDTWAQDVVRSPVITTGAREMSSFDIKLEKCEKEVLESKSIIKLLTNYIGTLFK